MAKQPPPEENFHVLCRIAKADLGEKMSLLSKNSIEVISCELVTTISTYKGVQHEVSNEDVLLKWIEDNPTFKASVAAKHFEDIGRAKSSVHYSLGKLVEKGVLKKLDEPGHYSRADVKHIEAPAKSKKAKPEKKTRPQHTKQGTDVILAYAKRNHGRFNTPKILDVFEKDGRARNSAYASIDRLLKARLIKRIGDEDSQSYVLLNSVANGNGVATPAAAEAEAEVANG